jgi:hypothetical protein
VGRAAHDFIVVDDQDMGLGWLLSRLCHPVPVKAAFCGLSPTAFKSPPADDRSAEKQDLKPPIDFRAAASESRFRYQAMHGYRSFAGFHEQFRSICN